MQNTSVTKRDVFIVTCESKHRKKLPSEIILGIFTDEELAKSQAEEIFQEKRKLFLERIHQISNFTPAALRDQKKCWTISYWPSGAWDMQEFMKVHVVPNYIRTDL